jgi:RNA polymerase sigma-70 factor (ECF subfamily)
VSPSTLAGAAEASVVALAVCGDHQAFAELVRRRQGMVRELMRRLCGDRAFAEDLAQQVFVQAWRQLPRLRGRRAAPRPGWRLPAPNCRSPAPRGPAPPIWRPRASTSRAPCCA